jgi:hypothetical protein
VFKLFKDSEQAKGNSKHRQPLLASDTVLRRVALLTDAFSYVRCLHLQVITWQETVRPQICLLRNYGKHGNGIIKRFLLDWYLPYWRLIFVLESKTGYCL